MNKDKIYTFIIKERGWAKNKDLREFDIEKQYYVYYIYFQDKDLEPVYVCDWYEDKEGAFINGWSRYKDFAYIFTTYDQARDVMLKLQASDEWEKYLIGSIAL